MPKAVITTLDNLELLKEQIAILKDDLLISQIVVVNNGSVDGTKEWLTNQPDLTIINRENNGAGPGRNAGLDAAGEFDYVLMLDGGIRPLRKATRHFLDYLERHPEVDVISPEIASCFTTETDQAHRIMPNPIDDSDCFAQSTLSSTAYCLCRKKAWDGIRFSEEGPFGEAGWGVDDNDMAFRWNKAGIVHHDFTGVLCYRRASGSFARIFRETGIWPNQYGSVYEKRLVKLWQDYPEQWNPWNSYSNPPLKISCVILGWNEYPLFAEAIQVIHEELKDIPHEVIFVDNGSTDKTKWWLDTFALRQPFSDTTIDNEQVLRRSEHPEIPWTGNVIRIDLLENLGTGYGFNRGFEKAKGQYIFYLAGDIIPTKGSIIGLLNHLESNLDEDYIGVNAWVCQSDTREVEFRGFNHLPRLGLGNYAFSYALIRRTILDAGCCMAEDGPFAGSGCGFEEAEFVNQMYSRGFRGYIFNEPAYYHQRRDFLRSGHEEVELTNILKERREWLWVRWPKTGFDVRHFHDQPPLRHIRQVEVVWKAVPNQPGPGGHFLSALQTICYAKQIEPGQESPGLDNYFFVDNGDYNHFHCPIHPAAFWAIDMITPQQEWRPSLDGYVERARTFDKVYAAQPCAVEYFKGNGIEAEWLPLAVNPKYFKPYDEELIYDWIALWHNVGDRITYTDEAMKYFPQGYIGWVGGLEYSQWLCRSRCALNLSRSNEITLRVFEVMASGVPLVSDRAKGMDLLFNEDEHFRGFSTLDEMLEQIEWIKGHYKESKVMANRARELILKKHTYYHRVLQVYGRQE